MSCMCVLTVLLCTICTYIHVMWTSLYESLMHGCSKLMGRAYRGDLSFLVSSEPLPSLNYRLVSWDSQWYMGLFRILTSSYTAVYKPSLLFVYRLPLWSTLPFSFHILYSVSVTLIVLIIYVHSCQHCSVSAWLVYFLMMASLMTFGLISYILFKNFQQFGIHIWGWAM